MRKLSFAISVLLFSFLFISCSGTTKQYLSPEIDDYSNETVSLLVINRNDFPDIDTNHQFGELRLNEQPIFRDRLIKLFREATGANVKGKMHAMDIDQSKFEVREFTEGGTNLKFLAPSGGTILNGNQASSRYVFLLDGFRFDTYEELVGGDSYAGHEPKVVPKITFETNYLIWDNDMQKAVAWGTVGSDKVIKLAQIEEIYDELLLDTFQNMNRRSPFRRSS